MNGTENTPQSLLTLVAAPELEDALVDWLLERDDMYGFSTMRIHGHGDDPVGLSLAEQVAGRRPRIMFQTRMPEEAAGRLIDDLRRDHAGSGVVYWLAPLLDSGRLD